MMHSDAHPVLRRPKTEEPHSTRSACLPGEDGMQTLSDRILPNRAPAYMGPAYWIPAFWVPALLVTHYVTFLVLRGDRMRVRSVVAPEAGSGLVVSVSKRRSGDHAST